MKKSKKDIKIFKHKHKTFSHQIILLKLKFKNIKIRNGSILQTKKDYLFNELTNIPQLPNSRGYEVTLKMKKKASFLEVPSHQYIYNLGKRR